MKKNMTHCFWLLAVLEILFIVLGDNIPFVFHPNAGILWTSIFIESHSLSVIFTTVIAVIFFVTGWAIQTGKAAIVVSYCIVGLAVAAIDLHLPLAVLAAGGSHALSPGGSGIMLIIALLFDVLPIFMAIRVLIRRRSANIGRGDIMPL